MNTRLPAVFFLVAIAGSSIFPAQARSREAEAAGERAVPEYLAGRYGEALPDLEKARDGGVASGPHLYMLAYCYDAVRHDAEASKKTYAAAREKLEKEITEKKPALESFFYLSNLLQNQGEGESSKKVASQAVAMIATKRIKPGKDGTSQFRAGKLHADAGDSAHALEFYRRAVAAFATEKDPPPAYLERALDPIARADFGKGDAVAVSETWEKLVKVNPKTADGDWNLGLAAIRSGRYAVARDAFSRARTDGGDRAQEAFYSARLSERALGLVSAGFTIPSKDTDGRTFASLSVEDLAERTKSYAQKLNTALVRAVQHEEYEITPPRNPKGKPSLTPGSKLVTEISEPQRHFVALVIERLLRTNVLQEEAFAGGYAPLIIQDWLSLWRSSHKELLENAADTTEQSKPG